MSLQHTLRARPPASTGTAATALCRHTSTASSASLPTRDALPRETDFCLLEDWCRLKTSSVQGSSPVPTAKNPSALLMSSCRSPVPASQPYSRSQPYSSALNFLFSLINIFYPKSKPCNKLLRVANPSVLVSQLYFSAPSLPSSLPAIRQPESADYTTAL